MPDDLASRELTRLEICLLFALGFLLMAFLMRRRGCGCDDKESEPSFEPRPDAVARDRVDEIKERQRQLPPIKGEGGP